MESAVIGSVWIAKRRRKNCSRESQLSGAKYVVICIAKAGKHGVSSFSVF